MNGNHTIELNWRRQSNEGDSRNDTSKLLGLRKWKLVVVIFGIFSILALTLATIVLIKVFAPEIDTFSSAPQHISQNSTMSSSEDESTEDRIQSLYSHWKEFQSNLTNDLARIKVENMKTNDTIYNLMLNIARLQTSVTESANNTRGKLQKLQQDIGWISIFNGYEYLVRRNGATFNQSRNYCRSKGGDLATVGLRSNITRKYIAEHIIESKTRFSTWIGLHDITKEGVWTWIDGQRATIKNTNFFPGEPNNFDQNQDCAYLHKYPSGYQMADFDCDSLLSSLCERRKE